MLRRSLYILFFVAFSFFIRAGEGPLHKKSGNGTRVHFGGSYGFYQVNTHHAKYNHSLPGFTIGVRREFHIDRQFKTYFGFGLDYFLHGLSYNSYYFNPDSVKIYDNSRMYYNYNLYIQELHLPLQMKFLFKQANNSLFSPYISLEYHLRYMLPGNLNIEYQGKSVKRDVPDLLFRNSTFGDKMSSFVSLGLGWQKNNLASSKHNFFIEINFRYGFADYYFQTPYSAGSMYTNGMNACVIIGFKI